MGGGGGGGLHVVLSPLSYGRTTLMMSKVQEETSDKIQIHSFRYEAKEL